MFQHVLNSCLIHEAVFIIRSAQLSRKFSVNRRFIVICTKAAQWSLSRLTSSHSLGLRPILMTPLLEVFRLKFCMHLSSLPLVLHIPLISSFLILLHSFNRLDEHILNALQFISLTANHIFILFYNLFLNIYNIYYLRSCVYCQI
jgi:hypothetical protein